MQYRKIALKNKENNTGDILKKLLELKGLKKDELRKILFNPYNGPLQQYKELLHTSTQVPCEVVEHLLNNACERHLGARGLHQQVGQLFQEAFLENKVQIEI